MVIVNPSLSVDELNTRKVILQSCKEASYLVKTMEPLVLWRDYYALDMCLTECNYAYNNVELIQHTFREFINKNKANAVQITAKFNEQNRPDTKVLYNLHEYVIYNADTAFFPMSKMYVKLHDTRQHHLTHGSYVAWSTLFTIK